MEIWQHFNQKAHAQLIPVLCRAFQQKTGKSRVVYKSRQPAKFAGFSVRFRRLLSLFEESRHVEEMMFMRSKLLGLNKNKNLQCLSFLKTHKKTSDSRAV